MTILIAGRALREDSDDLSIGNSSPRVEARDADSKFETPSPNRYLWASFRTKNVALVRFSFAIIRAWLSHGDKKKFSISLKLS